MKIRIKFLVSLIISCMILFVGGLSDISVKANEILGSNGSGLIGINNLNNTPNNSGVIGEQLKLPEKGWKRYDDKNSKIIYGIGDWEEWKDNQAFNSSVSMCGKEGSVVKFSFIGSKVRIISSASGAEIGVDYNDNRYKVSKVIADGMEVGKYGNAYPTMKSRQVLVYEYNFNTFGVHNIEITKNSPHYAMLIDAIEIDANGELVDSTNHQTFDAALEYQAHIQDLGWSTWVNSDSIAGTTGQSKRIEAVRIRLKAPYVSDNNLHVQYRAYVKDLGWLPWVENGAIAGTTGQAIQMEAIQIRIVDNNGIPRSDYELYYSAHVQNKGWLPEVPTNGIAGTVGEGLQMEALKVRAFKKS